MMTEEIEIYNGPAPTLTVQEIKAGVQIIQQVLAGVMIKGTHYDTLPGCGPKPMLLKPGAEKVLSTFRIAVDPIVEDLSTSDEARYRVTARGISQQTGLFLGAGIGEASTDEEKFKWQAAVCPEEYDVTMENRRRIKFKRSGADVLQVKQIRASVADKANTVLKMAKKRALVDLTLTVTAASDIFAQDLDDTAATPPQDIQQPARKSETAPVAPKPPAAPSAVVVPEGELAIQAVPEFYKAKDGKKPHSVKLAGDWYTTFSDTDGETLREANEAGWAVTVNYVMKGDYRNITGIPVPPDESVTPAAEAEPLPEFPG